MLQSPVQPFESNLVLNLNPQRYVSEVVTTESDAECVKEHLCPLQDIEYVSQLTTRAVTRLTGLTHFTSAANLTFHCLLPF